MTTNEKITKEPLFHLTKRANVSTRFSIIARVIAVVAALVFSGIILMLLSGENPFKIYASMFSGAFGSSRRIWTLLDRTAVLLGISLALTPAFRMKFWNCGGEGQTLIGAFATTACMFYLGESVPLPLLFVLMLLTSVLAGAIWGVIPAIFKALFGTNETLFTLMMNYIAIQVVKFCLKQWVTDGTTTLPTMPDYRFPKVFGQDYLLNVIFMLLICALLYVYLKYSKQGYEISVVGESEKTAKYIGISVKKVIIRTMVLSGAICGFVGMFLVANGACTITTDLVGGRGFTAILISWLAKFNPLIMILTSFLVAFLDVGAGQISTDFRMDTSICDILTAIILFFIIGCEFFIQYKINFRKSHKEEQV